MPVADHDLGIRADIDQHHDLFSAVHVYCEQVRGNVGPDVRANQRAAVDVGAGKDPEAQVGGLDVEGGRTAEAVQHLQLGDRLVGLLSYRLDVQAEDQVAHRRVAHDDDLVYPPPVDAKRPAHLADLEVDGGQHDLLQLAP